MVAKRLIPVLVLCQLVAAAALAQSVTTADPSVISSAEFGRGSAGQIEVITKQPSRLSGSFGISASRSQLPFGGNGKAFDATLGGTLVQDRVWFFASAQRDDSFFSSRFSGPVQSTPSAGRSLDSKIDANLGDRQNLAATFSSARQTFGNAATTSLPSSFLTMHYNAMVSDSMFFTATVSRTRISQPQTGLGALQQQ